MRDDEIAALMRARYLGRRADAVMQSPTLPERYESPRALTSRRPDHASMSRDEKIEAVVRMELHAYGAGDLAVGMCLLWPSRIIEAVDRSPHLPPSGIWIERARGRADLLAARAERESKTPPMDHRLVLAAARDAIHGLDTFHTLTRIRDAGTAEAHAPADTEADPF